MYNHRAVMADIYANRRERLRQLIEERFDWNQSKFAKALSFRQSSVSEYVTGAKTIGERVAHRIENAAGLPPGWLNKQDPRAKLVTREPLRGGRPPKHA